MNWKIAIDFIRNSYEAVSKLYKSVKYDSQDEETQTILEEFQDEYMKNGCDIISYILKYMIIIYCLSTVIFMSYDFQSFLKVCGFSLISFYLFHIMDRVFLANKNLAEVFLLINITSVGILIILRNIEQTSYTFNEYWVCYVMYCKYVGYFLFLKWKKNIIFYVITLNLYYDDISYTFYISILMTCAIFPITLIYISQKIKEMIILLKIKRDLIHTIRNVLQIFPEGVIIKSIDPVSKMTIIKFANDVASKFFNKYNDKAKLSDDYIVNIMENSNKKIDEKVTLSEFLNEQELKIDTNKFANTDEMVKLIDYTQKVEEINDFVRNTKDDIKNEEKSEFYSIKSIRVQWDNLDSFMHVFINTTQVKKLEEEERANRECQQSMFTSLSHDMRTPLNAITNSLQLIGFTIEEMKSKTSKFKDIDETLKPLYPRFERYIKIGDISSCLLLNLVEDILDLAKINAKMFKLNINSFELGIILEEIDYLFRFQCVERNLDFRIICDPTLFEYSFVSDAKRIKQVLINLASNSIKFTEKGVISIWVSQFDLNGDNFLKFKVRDTGIGINKNDIPKLFNRFSMLQKHMKFNACGSGIGLSISKMIVENLGGKISVTSEEGEWSEFKFTIKCEKFLQINREEIKDAEIYSNKEVREL